MSKNCGILVQSKSDFEQNMEQLKQKFREDNSSSIEAVKVSSFNLYIITIMI